MLNPYYRTPTSFFSTKPEQKNSLYFLRKTDTLIKRKHHEEGTDMDVRERLEALEEAEKFYTRQSEVAPEPIRHYFLGLIAQIKDERRFLQSLNLISTEKVFAGLPMDTDEDDN